jgi:threonine dehydrogenase-like Zn-dependent dehydrogenase
MLACAHESHAVPECPAEKVLMKTITIRGVRGRHREDVKAALRIIESGRYPLERLCTHVMAPR